MKYLKLFDNHKFVDYEKIGVILYNELLYGHYSVYDFDSDTAHKYMSESLFDMSSNINRIEKILDKLTSDRIEFDTFSNSSHYAPGHFKVNIDEYDKKSLIIGVTIYNQGRKGIMNRYPIAIIHKLKDEWFLVEFTPPEIKSTSTTSYYKCDQINGLIKFIKDNFKFDI